jgi:hypothetical protein
MEFSRRESVKSYIFLYSLLFAYNNEKNDANVIILVRMSLLFKNVIVRQALHIKSIG